MKPMNIDLEIQKVYQDNIFLRNIRDSLMLIIEKTHYINQVKRLEVIPYEFMDYDKFYNPN